MSDFKKFANSFQAVAKPGLLSIRELLLKLGNPQNELKFIHVAGTNGKGSVCAFLESILTKSGRKTGKYTSPNLIRVNERICVNGQEISDIELEQLLNEVEKACNALPEEIQPTQFEIWTAAAFLYFKKEKCDVVVLETGLGGEKDATNIIESNICSVITKISRDHVEYLGDDIDGIARAKAGIIKDGGFCITTENKEHVMHVISAAAEEKGNELTAVTPPVPDKFDGCSEIFSYKGINAKLSLCGTNQLENAALAAETALKLGIDAEIIKCGLESAVHPARFEMLGENAVYDGAHNLDGIRSLKENLLRYRKNGEINVIFSCMGDKDITAELAELKELNVRRMFCVKVKNNPRAKDEKELADLARNAGFDAVSCESIGEAVKSARDSGVFTVVCGSLYLYKDLAESEQKF